MRDIFALFAFYASVSASSGSHLRGAKDSCDLKAERVSRNLLSNILPYGPVSPGTLATGTLLTVSSLSLYLAPSMHTSTDTSADTLH
jgi:hypothetical protein